MAFSDFTRGQAMRFGSAGLAALAVVPGSLAAAQAAVDAFLYFDDGSIQGARPDHGIELDSFSFGAAQSGMHATGSGAGAGKIRFSDLQVTKRLDVASPKLTEACASGKHFPKLRLVAGGRTTTFDDVMIVSMRKAGGEQESETLTLSYAKIETSYQPQSPPGDRDVKVSPVMAPPKKP